MLKAVESVTTQSPNQVRNVPTMMQKERTTVSCVSHVNLIPFRCSISGSTVQSPNYVAHADT